MRWLDGGQSAMMQALDFGPAHLPAEIFVGPRERVMAGMKVHANTISHARLIALEETFPRTRDYLGHDRFNAHSRLFLEQPGVTGKPLAAIGEGFERFLAGQDETAGTASLARFESLWLESYHAADAQPLMLSALAGLAPEALLEQTLIQHPAAYAERFDPIVHALIGAEIPGVETAQAILIARPDAEVLVSPATALMADLMAALKSSSTIGNLFEQANEPATIEPINVDAIMQSLAALINAGAIVRL